MEDSCGRLLRGADTDTESSVYTRTPLCIPLVNACLPLHVLLVKEFIEFVQEELSSGIPGVKVMLKSRITVFGTIVSNPPHKSTSNRTIRYNVE